MAGKGLEKRGAWEIDMTEPACGTFDAEKHGKNLSISQWGNGSAYYIRHEHVQEAITERLNGRVEQLQGNVESGGQVDLETRLRD